MRKGISLILLAAGVCLALMPMLATPAVSEIGLNDLNEQGGLDCEHFACAWGFVSWVTPFYMDPVRYYVSAQAMGPVFWTDGGDQLTDTGTTTYDYWTEATMGCISWLEWTPAYTVGGTREKENCSDTKHGCNVCQ